MAHPNRRGGKRPGTATAARTATSSARPGTASTRVSAPASNRPAAVAREAAATSRHADTTSEHLAPVAYPDEDEDQDDGWEAYSVPEDLVFEDEDDDDDDSDDDEDDDDDEDEEDEDEEDQDEQGSGASWGHAPRVGPTHSGRKASTTHTAASYLAGHTIPLPTGGSFPVRPMSLTSMIERAGQPGGIPNSLVPAAERAVYGTSAAPAQAANRRARREAARLGAVPDRNPAGDMVPLMNFLVCQLVRGPGLRVVNKPQSRCAPGELSVHHIHEADKTAVMEFSLQGQKALKPFRRES